MVHRYTTFPSSDDSNQIWPYNPLDVDFSFLRKQKSFERLGGMRGGSSYCTF